MGIFGDPSNRFRDYIDKIKNGGQIRCVFCNKSREDILAEYSEYMKNPSVEFSDISIDDLSIITEKTQKPLCASCYFTVKSNPELIREIFERPEDEIW